MHGQERFWNRITLIKTKKTYCMLHNHYYQSKIYVDVSLSCKQMYKNRQSPAPNIKLKAKLYSESQSNGMLCSSALKRHSTLSSSQMKKSKKNYAYLKLQSLYTEKYCTTLIQRQLSSKTPNFLGFHIHLCCKKELMQKISKR